MMTQRFSLFSHIEDLTRNILVLNSPFEEARSAPLLCRYEIHRQSEDVLRPDESFQGLSRWHLFLPTDRDLAPSEDVPLATWERSEMPLASQCEALYHVTPNVCLPFVSALSALKKEGRTGSFAYTCHRDKATFGGLLDGVNLSQGNEQSPITAHRDVLAQHSGDANLGPWGNPYRIEGYKCLGLELLARAQHAMPTLVVHDWCGELLMGLLQAAQIHRHFHPDRVPFRLIAVVQQPYHQLAQAFEGGSADWRSLDSVDNPGYLPIPTPFFDNIVAGLMDHLGTVIRLAEDEGGEHLFSHAMERLVRTHFVDDEDEVYLLEARY